ncbi:hypothetical protein TWF696_001527 [Orbilia brochopaga]|uniref:Secreted protein n=1 Tax=Orbilia brochopaga TaxID=3140254 RepID=A0AAV9U941_9PEZI
MTQLSNEVIVNIVFGVIGVVLMGLSTWAAFCRSPQICNIFIIRPDTPDIPDCESQPVLDAFEDGDDIPLTPIPSAPSSAYSSHSYAYERVQRQR